MNIIAPYIPYTETNLKGAVFALATGGPFIGGTAAGILSQVIDLSYLTYTSSKILCPILSFTDENIYSLTEAAGNSILKCSSIFLGMAVHTTAIWGIVAVSSSLLGIGSVSFLYVALSDLVLLSLLVDGEEGYRILPTLASKIDTFIRSTLP